MRLKKPWISLICFIYEKINGIYVASFRPVHRNKPFFIMPSMRF